MQRGIQVYFDDKKNNKSYLVPGAEYYAAKITSQAGKSLPYGDLYHPPNKTYYTTNTPIRIGTYKERRDDPRGHDYVFDTEVGRENYVRINNPAPLNEIRYDDYPVMDIISSTNINELETQPSYIPKYGFISKADLAEQTPKKGGKKRRRTNRKRPKRKSRKKRRKSIRR